MMPKVLFLVLVGCAMVLAKPALLNEEVSNEVEVPNKSAEVEKPKESAEKVDESNEVEVPKSNEVEIVEVDEEELKEIIEKVEQKINEIFEKVNEGFNEESFKKAFEEIQKLTEQIFGQKKSNLN